MKTWAFFIPLLLLANTVFSQERILSYFSDIRIEKSGSILVEEKITVLSEGVKIRKGIFRDFPTQYKDRLGYYMSIKDAATHFFFDKINKGTYVIEYDIRVNNSGEFSNGITTIESMYAPEFSNHNKGIRVKVN